MVVEIVWQLPPGNPSHNTLLETVWALADGMIANAANKMQIVVKILSIVSGLYSFVARYQTIPAAAAIGC